MVTTNRALSKDDEFLFKLYASTREEELSTWGWGEEEQELFLQMQFQAQRQHYSTQYPNQDHRIIYQEGLPIGRIFLSRDEQSITLVDITILPSYQKKGIGTQLIMRLQDEAAIRNQKIILHVHIGSQAQHLYQRLGFKHMGTNEVYMRMEWSKTS